MIGNHRGEILEHPRTQFRQGIEQRGDEHVAGHAADNIEVNMAVIVHGIRKGRKQKGGIHAES